MVLHRKMRSVSNCEIDFNRPSALSRSFFCHLFIYFFYLLQSQVHLALASAVDPTQALASAGVACACRLEASHQSAASASTQGSEGNDTTSRWVSFHRGAATRVAIRDIPIDQVTGHLRLHLL